MASSAERHLVDTSVAVAHVLVHHPRHRSVSAALRGRRLGLSGHAAFETLSVLTRLPPAVRLTPEDAARVIASNFPHTAHLSAAAAATLVPRLAALGVSGGSVFDGLVAATAIDHRATLVTLDVRALPTYAALGATVELLSGD